MAWFLIAVLTLATVLALLAVLMMAAIVGDDDEAERVRIELEIRQAERRLHDIARNGLEAMLDEARRHTGAAR